MKNILLVDDDADDCLLLSQALASVTDHVHLCCTDNIDLLLKFVDCLKPSLIIIDFFLPKKSGLHCLRQIKSHPYYHDIPVVMWSTLKMRNHVLEAYREGAQDFVQKPSSYVELVIELKTILQRNGIAAQQRISPITLKEINLVKDSFPFIKSLQYHEQQRTFNHLFNSFQ